MKSQIALRFKTWREVMTSMGIIEGQKTIASIIKSRTGKPVSQAYVSNLELGNSNFPEKHLYAIHHHYPFTKIDYFLSGDSEIAEFQEIVNFLCRKHKISKSRLTKEIDNEEITEPVLSSLNNKSSENKWEIVFNYFNEKYNYNISTTRLLEKQRSMGIATPKFEGKSPQVRRLFELIEYLKDKGVIMSMTDFANSIGIGRNLLYNMKLPDLAQDVTKDMLVAIANRYPKINIEWLLLGRGNRFKDETTLLPDKPDIEILSKKINLLMTQIQEMQKDQHASS